MPVILPSCGAMRACSEAARTESTASAACAANSTDRVAIGSTAIVLGAPESRGRAPDPAGGERFDQAVVVDDVDGHVVVWVCQNFIFVPTL